MKELDLLKKDWKKNENSFEQVSEIEIYKMLHAKSSSVVKWILIISILEFVILNGISYLLPDDQSKTMLGFENFLDVIELFSYGVTFFFMFLFYKNYQSISATCTVKKLMETILKTRKTVQYYIIYNLVYVFIILSVICVYLLGFDPVLSKKTSDHLLYVYCLVPLFIIIVIVIIWLFYKLLYGFLLRKLHTNYEELKKIDL